MTERNVPQQLKEVARITGGLYLLHIAAVAMAQLLAADFVGAVKASSADPLLHAAEPLFRLSLAADLVTVLTYVAVTGLLYVLLKPAGGALSFIAALLSVCGCSVGAVLILFKLAPLTLGNVGAQQALKLAGAGNNVALAFFGSYCLLLGLLVIRSGYLPKAIGTLLIGSGCAWLTLSFSAVLSPAVLHVLFPVLLPIGAFGEFALALWLAVKGINVGPHKRAEPREACA